ncbi:MAG: thiamine pyrophosphate-dependent dehydrogenase E1 component subunit alpha [Chloroflexi bacterium]|nr:thiamine pyrophosphate-dependent dehydrogenase E1 component subunit alpha [Chloroflexota bacterium]
MTDTAATPPSEQGLTWLRQMVEIRLFEEKVQELYLQGLVEGTTHLAQGQEAVAVGAVTAMRPQDYLTITYRGHGQALARGMEMEPAFAELMGRASGCCHGVGGSMHLTDASRGLIGAFAIVGAGLPVALGAAMSSKLRGGDAVALTFFGDGAVNIGTFHESLNMASVWKAPIVFIIENNLYGEFTPMRDTTPLDDLADRAAAYAMPGIVVDGQDVEAVHEATDAAVARARGGGGPSLIEAKTYRYRGHSRSDPAKYRPAGELDAWKARDPIDLYAARLTQARVLTGDEVEQLKIDVQTQVDEAAARAATAPFPQLEEIRAYVYAD